MRSLWKWILCAAVVTLGASGSRAEMIELVGGRSVQGKILAGQTGEDGLALELFDTGGVILVRWDHIVPARAKQLRTSLGIDPEEAEEIMVPGHRVLLKTNVVVEGLALNPNAMGEPLQLKTRTGVQTFERPNVTRIDGTQLPGLFVYDPEELYQTEIDKNPPTNAAANKDMAVFCMRIGALEHAKKHLAAAAADPEFAGGPGGKDLPVLQRQLDGLIKSKGAQDMTAQIRGFMRSKDWNRALETLKQLDATYTDESVRKLIHFDLLASQVVRGRDGYFASEVQKRVQSTMTRLIEAKSREKKPALVKEEEMRGVAAPGSLASARQWLARDLPKAIWDKVQADLGLTADEMDTYWKDRSSKKFSTATYGSGSFIVVKRAQQPKTPGGDNRPQRRPGAGQQQGGPPRQTKEDKPKTEEEWWQDAPSAERARWLTAFFVESSGIFEVIRVDESQLCESCGGRGVNVTNNTDGSTSSTICTACNGATKIRKVIYR